MCMKKRKYQPNNSTPSIETIYDPYRISADDTFDEIYARYLKDKSTVCEIDGLIFYKAAQITKINIRQKGLIVALPREVAPDNNCIYIDENGNRYDYRGAEMIRFKGTMPEWGFKMIFAILSYPEGDIGEYFAKQTIL